MTQAAVTDSPRSLLSVEGLIVGYQRVGVLVDVSLAVPAGSVTAIIGSNGAGKSTLLRAISGLLRPTAGHIVFDGEDITHARPDRIVSAGVLHVAEGRRLFRRLSVRDNLELGLFGEKLDRATEARRLSRVLELFPMLGERMDTAVGALSGGQQQMLAIGQALMREPRLLLLDEPSLGLAPVVIDQVFAVLKHLHAMGTTLLLVEQMVERALEIADHAYVMRSGRMLGDGTPRELQESSLIRSAYLGVTGE